MDRPSVALLNDAITLQPSQGQGGDMPPTHPEGRDKRDGDSGLALALSHAVDPTAKVIAR